MFLVKAEDYEFLLKAARDGTKTWKNGLCSLLYKKIIFFKFFLSDDKYPFPLPKKEFRLFSNFKLE